MGQAPLSDDLAREAAEAFRQFGEKQRAAASLGIPVSTYHNRLKHAVNRGMLPPSPRELPPGFVITGHSVQYDKDGDISGQSIRSVPEPGGVFAPREGHVIKGESALVDAEGRTRARWIKTKEGERDPQWIAKQLREALTEHPGRAHPVTLTGQANGDLATVFPLADLHFGLYAWRAETGEDFDLSIADETNRTAFAELMASTPASDTAVILGLGDLTHTDNSSNQTARSGNALDVDTRYSKVLKAACLFMVFAVDLALQRHGRVLVRNLPGNHDDHTALAITLALWSWFRDEPRVEVDDDPGRFWWWRWGSNFIGATHGDTVKMDKLPLVMAASRPEDWGSASYRYVMTGHIHHKSGIEEGGVVVESFQSPAARDAWHHAAGYRAGRSLSAITFHKTLGERSRQRVNIG